MICAGLVPSGRVLRGLYDGSGLRGDGERMDGDGQLVRNGRVVRVAMGGRGFFFFFFFFAFRLDRVVGYFSEMITERPGDGGKGKRKESDREKRKRRRKEKEASSETRIKMDRSGRRGENQIMTEDELVMLDVVVW